MQKYLYSASVASRLALMREIQLHYVSQDYKELHEIVMGAMIHMGLTTEAKRLCGDV
ncbi:hypothetical protein [Solibacillus sp. R5-41]|uniref:hypothetical protein n=1 Tax=Solibacillus sp. R5-41 TaxID=2048654 RepID=UPI0012FD48E5|nr:hypothetical protein [Solibacillus sp. R5-41]